MAPQSFAPINSILSNEVHRLVIVHYDLKLRGSLVVTKRPEVLLPCLGSEAG